MTGCFKETTMKKAIGLTLIILLLTTSLSMAQGFSKFKNAVLEKTGQPSDNGLSEDIVAAGLKEALDKGVEKGVDQLSQPDGFFKDLEVKIPLPQEAREVESLLRKMGMDKQVDEAVESLNRAAEDAVTGATDIFVDAIKTMTITDAMGILRGGDDAASNFLEKATRTSLVEKFKPTVKASLDKVGATQYWHTVFSTYNKLPFVQDINPDLDDYVTNKAIDGLFLQIRKQELAIRKDPGARVTDLLRKVFG